MLAGKYLLPLRAPKCLLPRVAFPQDPALISARLTRGYGVLRPAIPWCSFALVGKYFFRMSPLGRFFHSRPLMGLPSPETKLRRSLGSDIEFAKTLVKGPFWRNGTEGRDHLNDPEISFENANSSKRHEELTYSVFVQISGFLDASEMCSLRERGQNLRDWVTSQGGS